MLARRTLRKALIAAKQKAYVMLPQAPTAEALEIGREVEGYRHGKERYSCVSRHKSL